jgi:hypothetical protein
MKKITLMLAASLLALASVGVQASFVTTDWKTTGDGLAFVEESTGIEWLSLTQTDNMSISEVQGLLSTTFEGWRLPTQSEVESMYTNLAAINFASYNNFYSGSSPSYENVATRIVSRFGVTHTQTSFSNVTSAGIYLSQDQNNVLKTYATYKSNSQIFGRTYMAILNNINSITATDPIYGVYLVSDGGTTLSSISNPDINALNPQAPVNNVPVTSMLGGLILLVLGARRKLKL